MRLFKVLNKDFLPANGGSGRWNLPTARRPGQWMSPIQGGLIPCQNGYHLCREQDLIHWLGPHIFEAEYRGEIIEGDDKVIVREARLLRYCSHWDDTNARMFAAHCATAVLPIFEKEFPSDDRPRLAIEAAYLFSLGDIDHTAGAAWAARAAAWAAGAAGDARAAARDAARAAWAARAAAGDAAWAARAARDAAWNARAARDAAGAARAAWDAAGDAQTQELMELLGYRK